MYANADIETTTPSDLLQYVRRIHLMTDLLASQGSKRFMRDGDSEWSWLSLIFCLEKWGRMITADSSVDRKRRLAPRTAAHPHIYSVDDALRQRPPGPEMIKARIDYL